MVDRTKDGMMNPSSTSSVLQLFSKNNHTQQRDSFHPKTEQSAYPATNNVVTGFFQRRMVAIASASGWQDPVQRERLSKRLIEARGLFESIEIKIKAAQKWGITPISLTDQEHVKLNKLCALLDDLKVNSKLDHGRMSELEIISKIARMWRTMCVKPQDMPKEQPEVKLAFNPRPK